MTETLRILILEDCAPDAELMMRALGREGISFTATRVWTEADFVAALRDSPPHLILADYSLPGYGGLSALGHASTEHPEIPFIVVSGSLGEEAAVDLLHQGATDYVLKDRLGRLGPAVRHALGAVEERARRERAEQQLHEHERRFQTVFDEVVDGIILADPGTGAFTMVNRAMCAMVGYSESEILSMSVKDIHLESDLPAIQALFRMVAVGTLTAAHDVAVRRKDGTSFFVDINAARVTIDGHPLLMGSFRDVTERRALQASVTQADRLASMGMLAAGVAHEINNPLSYVLYNLESLALDLPALAGAVDRSCAALRAVIDDRTFDQLVGDDREMLESSRLVDLVRSAREALAGTQRIKEIARGLGAFCRIDKTDQADVDLRQVMEGALTMAQNEIKYRARLVKDLAEVPVVVASEGGLSQVFLNLLINAAHAIDEGNPSQHTVSVRTWTEDGRVYGEVADTGKGIPPEILPHIFEPFFTTKPKGMGSGLGLTISRNIISALGGDIRVESQVGRGTRFVVDLPVKATREARGEHAVVRETPDAPALHGRVLVVDDEEPIRRMLQRMLGRAHEVVTAASGREGRTILEADQSFDLILCDLMMPEMTGMDLHEWLVARDPVLANQIVFLSGGAFTPRASTYLAGVGNLRIEKPVDATSLRRVVADEIQAFRARQQAIDGAAR